jgi:two-component system, NtrC family, sensor histidine kinase GlrK
MKRLTLFSRLIVSYLFIFVLLLAMSVYAVFQLGQIETITRSILDIDQRLTEYEKKMTDALLSQMRFERKYLVMRDKALYAQFLLAQGDFEKSLAEAIPFAETPNQKNALQVIREQHEGYKSLIEQELEFVRAHRPYSQKWFKEEKEKKVDQILGQLKILSSGSRQDTLAKVEKLGEAGAEARRVALNIAIIALAGVIIVSFWVTRSITRPISILIAKTREISQWIFKGDLHLSSPPEIKELSHALNAMCDQLQAVDRMKSDFFATMSHELRTPLTSIKEGTSLLLEGIGGEVTEKQKKILQIISGESRRLIDSVNSSLDLSKMEAGMVDYHFSPGDIHSLIRQAVEEIKPLAMAKRIRLEAENDQNLPQIRVDSERILQVLRNFIGNALKFTPEDGQVTVGARPEKGNLRIWVTDTGPGIPKENLGSIFEKYQQGSLNGSGSMKGTGLGLAIAKHIITAHGGRVWAESEAGQGSSFIFVLPA